MHAARGKNRRLGGILTGPTGGDKHRVRPAATAEQGNHCRAWLFGSQVRARRPHRKRPLDSEEIVPRSFLFNRSFFRARLDPTRHGGGDERGATLLEQFHRADRHGL